MIVINYMICDKFKTRLLILQNVKVDKARFSCKPMPGYGYQTPVLC